MVTLPRLSLSASYRRFRESRRELLSVRKAETVRQIAVQDITEAVKTREDEAFARFLVDSGISDRLSATAKANPDYADLCSRLIPLVDALAATG